MPIKFSSWNNIINNALLLPSNYGYRNRPSVGLEINPLIRPAKAAGIKYKEGSDDVVGCTQ
jgi:hypothetical protein